MNRVPFVAIVPCLSLVLTACAPDITKNETTPGARAVFDPTTATLPLPSDLLKDPTTGLLNLPADPADSELTKQIKVSLNDIDGWLTGSTITLPFDAPLDPASLTADSVLLIDAGDATEPPAVERMTAESYYALFNVGREPATKAPYNVIVKTTSPGPLQASVEFKQGHRYAVVVTDAAKGADGLPAISGIVYDYLKSSTPLVDAQGHSKTILPDADAASLEFARSKIIGPVFDALEAKGIVNRQHALSFTVFSTQSGARPGFNPLPIGRVMPTPIDSASKPADAALDVAPEVQFDLPYEPTSASDGVFMYKVGTALTPVSVGLTTTETANDKGLYPLKIVPKAPLAPSTSYVVVLTKSVKSKSGVPAQPSVYFTLVRATTPLIDESTTPASVNSPFVDLTLDVLILLGKDPATAKPEDWTSAYNTLIQNLKGIEDLRTSYAGYFDSVEAAGIPRADTIALWTFTTAAQ